MRWTKHQLEAEKSKGGHLLRGKINLSTGVHTLGMGRQPTFPRCLTEENKKMDAYDGSQERETDSRTHPK